MESIYLNGGFIGPTFSFGDTDRYIIGGAAGQAEFTTPGTFSWTAPEGVTSVSVVCVGAGGGSAANTSSASGAGGGGLGWKNNISVTPGLSYTVTVGSGGTRVASGTAPAGGNSFFINTSTVAGFGGLGGVAAANANRAGGGFVGDGGGVGGAGGSRVGSTVTAGGGGGAGGYSGSGGAGGNGSATAGTLAGSGSGGGGGGGGRGGSVDSAGSGGGVGIYGEGSNGSGGVNSGNDGGSGFGGSGGEDGYIATTTDPGNIYGTGNPSTPGRFGGGGCGADTTTNEQARGADGAVRIIWGDERAFPATNTADGALNFGNQKNSGIWLLQSVYDIISKNGQINYRYYRWVITAIRDGGPDSLIQASEFTFQLDNSDIVMSGATVTNIAGSSPTGEQPPNLIDGNVSTKWLNLSGISGQGVQFDFGTQVNTTGYRWATANDAIHRDPISWDIQGSNDEINWTTLDTKTNETITTTRVTYVGPYQYGN
jgi:hypothetical protein